MALMLLVEITLKPTFTYGASRALAAVDSVSTTTHETSRLSEEPLASWSRVSACSWSILVNHTDRVVIGASVAAKSAFQIAKEGGKHAGTLTNYAGRSSAEIRRAITGYERQVTAHGDKLANPAAFAERWGQMTAREQAGLLRRLSVTASYPIDCSAALGNSENNHD